MYNSEFRFNICEFSSGTVEEEGADLVRVILIEKFVAVKWN